MIFNFASHMHFRKDVSTIFFLTRGNFIMFSYFGFSSSAHIIRRFRRPNTRKINLWWGGELYNATHDGRRAGRHCTAVHINRRVFVTSFLLFSTSKSKSLVVERNHEPFWIQSITINTATADVDERKRTAWTWDTSLRTISIVRVRMIVRQCIVEYNIFV